MITLKEVKAGAELPQAKYKIAPYVVVSESNLILFAGDPADLMELSEYYDDCEVKAREHDLYLRDNTIIEYTITANQIDDAAQEMAEKTEWGWKEYRKENGEWRLDHILVVNTDKKQTLKIYADRRHSEIIEWHE